MKFAKVLGFMMLLGAFACGGSDNTNTTDEGQVQTDTIQGTDTTVPEDTTTPRDEAPGTDTTPGTDTAGTDTTPGTDTTVEDVGCTPKCTDKQCGPDLCGGTCGTCTGTDVCVEATGVCKPLGVIPTAFGPAGYISALQTPADPTAAQTACVDFTADGKGDSSLVNLAGQLNGPLSDAIKGGDIGIIFEFGNAEAPVADFANAAAFTLSGLLGKPATAGDLTVQVVGRDSFGPDNSPLISFAGATITAGALAAGPSKFALTIPVEGIPLSLTLNGATLKGAIDADSSKDAGVSLKTGVLAGIITKDEVDKVIADLQTSCDAAPADAKPSYCQYLTVAKSAEALLFTLHDNGDGTYVAKSKDKPGNAAAACFTYELSKVKGLSLEPAPAQ